MTPDKVPLPKAAVEEPVQEEPDESIRLSNIGDAPSAEDALGFKPYVDAIASFLVSPKTEPPLTLSIEGEWGSGKSSFMLQLKNAITGESSPVLSRLKKAWNGNESTEDGKKSTRRERLWAAIKQKPRFAVQFNPWRHDREDSLWAAFALEFLRQVSHQRSFVRRWWGGLKLFVAHYQWKKGWFEALRAVVIWIVMIVLVVGLPLDVFLLRPAWVQKMAAVLSEKLNSPSPEVNHAGSEPQSAKDAKEKPEKKAGENFDVVLKTLLSLGGTAAYFAVVLTIWLKAKDVVGNPLEIDLKKYLKSPEYEGRVAFVEQFHEDFRKIVDAYAGRNRVFVVVDDLDRCEVPKAAELIKAVNLLIADDPRLIFILGMDREKVAAGLAVKYEKMLPYLLADSPADADKEQWKRRGGLEFGQAFLQKFIQLPFRVPGPNLETYSEFIGTISGPLAAGGATPERPAPNVPTRTASTSTAASDEAGDSMATEDSAAEMPRTRPATLAQAKKRRERELQFHGDSEKVRAAALMFATTLGMNPRRMKQYINLLRLQAYIVNSIGLFDRGAEGGTPITMEQLGKFVAVSLKWPALLAEFAAEPTFLEEIEDYANGRKKGDEMGPKTPQAPALIKRWLDERGMVKFLRYGIEKDEQHYTLKNPTLYRLLHICPQRIKPSAVRDGVPPMA